VDRVSDANKGGQEGLDFVTLASKTEGYSISDLGDLVNNTLQQSMIRSSKEDTDSVSYHLIFYCELTIVLESEHDRFRTSSSCLYTDKSPRSYTPEIISKME
jgi:hypothetical protein